jgi:histidinol-phosphate aminotransferase
MGLTRRELIAGSALLMARPGTSFARNTAADAASMRQDPIVLCWNENPYGPGPAARAAVAASIAESCRYPDEDINLLISAIAGHESLGLEYIVTGTGSGELLCALGLLHGRDGGEIIAAEPTFAELPNYARHSGAALRFVAVDANLRHDLAAMRGAVSERTRAVYICNPNNPTGTAIAAGEIRSFVDSLPEYVTTIIDEAYLDFADAANIASAADLARAGRRVVVLRTFSKIHGLAGLRCGYAIARPDIAAEIGGVRMSTANILAVRAARASLSDRAFLADCRRRVLASRARITNELGKLGLAYAEPQGNFVFFDTGMTLTRFTERMLARNIRVGRRFAPYENWCRITIGTESEVDSFLAALRLVSAEGRQTRSHFRAARPALATSS